MKGIGVWIEGWRDGTMNSTTRIPMGDFIGSLVNRCKAQSVCYAKGNELP